LNYHIGKCKAPCNKLITEEEYDNFLHEVEQFILGKDIDVSERLKSEMAEAAEAMEFEKAAQFRDTLFSLAQMAEKQKVETGDDDRDIIAIARSDEEALFQVFFVRGGKLSGREHYMMSAVDLGRVPRSDAELLEAFIKQFYSEATVIPKEIVIPCVLPDVKPVTDWLAILANRVISITIPQKGEKKQMLNLAETNAKLTMSQFGTFIKKEAEKNAAALDEITTAMGVDFSVERIEAYDISNIQGYESVGSMIVFEGGKAKKSDYRKFKLKAAIGPDDYAGMEEILTRRLKRYKEGHESFAKMPDIIFVDGGKGHVSTAKKVLETLGLNIPVCGMVKDDRHRTSGLIWQNNEVNLKKNSEGFKLITRIQDEVHRFALEYHRKLRADSQVKSVLDEIEGVGATRRKALLKHFKSIEAIGKADVETLAKAPAMNKRAAEAVYKYFNRKDDESHGSKINS